VSRESDIVRSGSRHRTGPRRHLRDGIVPTDEQHGVTTLELFFDLVFVFAITQVTAFMADELGWRGTPTPTCTFRWWPASSTSPWG
jgi:low temperature requirement protein LtrA